MEYHPTDIRWSELNTYDPEAAKNFFEKNFGWSFNEAGTGSTPYLIAEKDGAPIAGIFTLSTKQAEAVCPHWQNYTPVPDVEAACKNALREGAQLVRAPLQVPRVGRMAVFKKKDGELVGMITPDESQ